MTSLLKLILSVVSHLLPPSYLRVQQQPLLPHWHFLNLSFRPIRNAPNVGTIKGRVSSTGRPAMCAKGKVILLVSGCCYTYTKYKFQEKGGKRQKGGRRILSPSPKSQSDKNFL